MVKPETWGPHLWRLLHSVIEQVDSNAYMLSEKLFILFEVNVPKIIPCEDCRKGYLKFKLANPIQSWRFQASNHARESARVWLWNLHETVNRRLNKPVSPEIKDLPEVYGKEYIPWLLDGFVAVIQPITGNLATQDPSKSIDSYDLQQFKGSIRSLDSYKGQQNASVLHW